MNPRASRAPTVERLARTPATLERLVAGRGAAALSKRPDAKNWSPTEILCHLRDVEELFQVRFHTILALDEPTILVLGAQPEHFVPWRLPARHPLDPNVWAEERQYARSDPHEALAAFQKRRAEVVTLLGELSEAERQRGGIHLARGRLTLAQWAASLAGHDDNHLAQLERALEGKA
jgi:hypothetical protein